MLKYVTSSLINA